MFTLAGMSSSGVKKTINQDAYCACAAQTPLGDAALIAVCDGVGGLTSGELASSVAVNELAAWFDGDFKGICGGLDAVGRADARPTDASAALDEAERSLRGLLADLHRRMRAYSEGLCVRMGTTLTAALLLSGRWLVAHVGDTRAYKVSAEEWELLTDDQVASPGSSQILQAVGAQEVLTPVFERGGYTDGDLMMTCCDGFWRRLDPSVAGARLRTAAEQGERELRAAQTELIVEAMRLGEKDNITVACAFSPGRLHNAPPALEVCRRPARPARDGAAPGPRRLGPGYEEEETLAVPRAS